MSALRLRRPGTELAALSRWRGKRLSPAMTVGVAASVAVHALLAVYLYGQRFELETPPAEEGPVMRVIPLFRPPPPPEPEPVARQPQPSPPKAPTVAVRDPAPTPYPVEPAPFPPTTGSATTTTEPPVLTTSPPSPIVEPAAGPGPAAAEPAPRMIVRPKWISRPTGEQVARAYPSRALEREQQGRAVLQCSVTARGEVTACRVTGETPSGAGFGDAALKLARHFRMSPQTEDGRPIEGGVVRVPVTFRLAD